MPATARSQAATRPIPPARAGPPTRASTGLGDSQIAVSSSGNAVTGMSCAAPAAGGGLEVHPGAEDPAGVREHDHPDGPVGQRRPQPGRELAHQPGRERVAVVRGVEGERGDPAATVSACTSSVTAASVGRAAARGTLVGRALPTPGRRARPGRRRAAAGPRCASSAAARSGSTCTSRSAPPAAATATSPRTRRRSWDPASPGPRTPTPPCSSCGWPGTCSATGRRRSRPSSSAAARRRCCRPGTWPRCCGRSTSCSGSRRASR